MSVPKSLHTVTVLVRLGRTLQIHAASQGLTMSHARAIDSAMEILDLRPSEDSYGLGDSAERKLASMPRPMVRSAA